MLEVESQALLSLQPKALLYPLEMSLGKRIRTARKAIPHLTQTAVGNALGISDKAVSAWERDEVVPTPDKFPKLAALLKQTVAYLHGESDKVPASDHNGSQSREGNATPSESIASGVRNPPSNMIPAADFTGEADLPVYAIVQGGRGVLVLENEPFTRARRPKRLAGNRDSYGVLVIGNSMAREYNENDIANIDPHLNPRKDDPCLFRRVREDGTVEVMLKYLDRAPDASETVYYVSQTNPPKKFTIKKADWPQCHVAIGKESGR